MLIIKKTNDEVKEVKAVKFKAFLVGEDESVRGDLVLDESISQIYYMSEKDKPSERAISFLYQKNLNSDLFFAWIFNASFLFIFDPGNSSIIPLFANIPTSDF